MKAGSWPSILCVYLFGVLGVASVSKMLPLAGDFLHAFGASSASFAFLVSMLALPAAVLATVGGAIVDRIGARRTLIASALIGALADALYARGSSMLFFQIVRVFEGLTMVGIFTAAPSLLMATTAGRRRVSAMTLWSTYTPTGFSLGLVLAAAYADTPNWRWTFVLHGGLFVLAAALALALPQPATATQSSMRPSWLARSAELLSAYGQIGPLRLALSFGCIICLGLGVSTVMPYELSTVHQLSIGAASNLLAAANFTMILGAYVTNSWLGNGLRPSALYSGLAVVGSLAGAVLFWPQTSLITVVMALCAWLLVTGAATAFDFAVLPGVVTDPRAGAAAAGLISQVSSLVTLVTPPIWLGTFGHGGWLPFLGLIVVGWVASLLLLPAAATRFTPTHAVTARAVH